MDRWRHTDDKIEQLADFSLESKAFWLGHDEAELMASQNAVRRTIGCLRIDIGYGKEGKCDWRKSAYRPLLYTRNLVLEESETYLLRKTVEEPSRTSSQTLLCHSTSVQYIVIYRYPPDALRPPLSAPHCHFSAYHFRLAIFDSPLLVPLSRPQLTLSPVLVDVEGNLSCVSSVISVPLTSVFVADTLFNSCQKG